VTSRVDVELALLREEWPGLTYELTGQWVLLPCYPLPEGWSKSSAPVAFQIPLGPPGTPPYAFYLDGAVAYGGQQPGNYAATAAGVPFPGTWGVFSWAPEGWPWAEDPANGANMSSFARSFADRFAEGV
jgi:hypothetical protein